jgi:PadR family transcriptional regulator PadR
MTEKIRKQQLLAQIVRRNFGIIVLGILRERKVYGYELIFLIRKQYGVYLGSSTIYPVLIGLEKDGFVKSNWVFLEKYRRVYGLTDEGEKLLEFMEPVYASLKLGHGQSMDCPRRLA